MLFKVGGGVDLPKTGELDGIVRPAQGLLDVTLLYENTNRDTLAVIICSVQAGVLGID